MPVMLERWNDDKMDALKDKVDDLGNQMREQRQETRELRQEMKAGFEQMHRTMLGGVIAMTNGFLAGFAALVVLIATLH
jgi:hypothetical protein